MANSEKQVCPKCGREKDFDHWVLSPCWRGNCAKSKTPPRMRIEPIIVGPVEIVMLAETIDGGLTWLS